MFRSATVLQSLRIPRADMPLLSVIYGLFRVLAQLGATVDARALLAESLAS